MIQRIQTLFLILATAAAGALHALPFATTPAPLVNSEFFADASFTIQDHIGLLILFSLAGVLSLVAVFLYRDRKRQSLVVRLSIVAGIIAIIFGVIMSMQDLSTVQTDNFQEQAGVFLPPVFLLFAILALVYIRKDEKLVRSADRLR